MYIKKGILKVKGYISLALATILLLAVFAGCRAGETPAESSSAPAAEMSGATSEDRFEASPMEDFQYAENDTGITIFAYLGSDENVVVPETYRGKPVTEIGKNSFEGKIHLTSVKIPETVTKIDVMAFRQCVSLTTIVLPEGLKSIGAFAFEQCKNLSEVTLPSTLSTLEGYAFTNCSSLKHIRIPKSLSNWGEYAFNLCGLETIELEEGLESIGAFAFRMAHIKEIVLPESIKVISEFAFEKCEELESITLNEGLITIEPNAFYSASALTEIVIPSTVTTITEDTFAFCDGLQAVKFEGNAPETYPGKPPQPDSLEVSYTIYYHEGAEGFTSPEWFGYPTRIW